MKRAQPLIIAALLLAACSPENDTDTSDAGNDPADAGTSLPPPICLDPGDGPHPLSFTDVTAELGLGPEGLNIAATNVSVADVDGDGWPDLALTKGSSTREDPASPVGLYRLLRNEEGAGFSDWTFSSGLFRARDGAEGRASTYVVFADVDNDGDVDAFSSVYEDADKGVLEDHSSILLNDGSGSFTIGPEQSFSGDVYDPLVSAAFLDHDRDGILDLFAGHHYGIYGMFAATIQDSLYRGDGTGGFADVTDEAGLATLPFDEIAAAEGTTHKPTWGVTACDVDGDGWTDLMTANYGRMFNSIYRNKKGVFEDLSLSSGFASDEREDYSDDNFYRCFCQAYPDEPTCAGAQPAQIICDGMENNWTPGFSDQPFRLGGNSSNTVCGDVDNDGDMDLLAVELAHWHIGGASDKTELLINDGFPGAPFSRPGNAETGLERTHDIASWNEGDLAAAMADLDNDGRLDVLVASSDYPSTYSLLWQQDSDGRFFEVGEASGTRLHRAHGLGLVDFDRDGDLDLLVGTSLMRWSAGDDPPAPDNAYAYLLRNDTGQDVNKLIFQLKGKGAPGGANRGAIGARITVITAGETRIREIQGGHGLYSAQHDPLVYVGIGADCVADEVRVRWPNAAGDEVVFKSVMANYLIFVEEGEDLVYRDLEPPATEDQP